MPWWVVGPSASEEDISSIKAHHFFPCLFTSDLDICKSVGMLQTKFLVPISFICTYDTFISYFVPINNITTNNNARN